MKKIFLVFCIVITILIFTACGNSQSISGTYKLIEMTAGGQDITSYLSSIEDVTLVIEGDKAQLIIGEDITEMTIDTDAQTMTGESAPSPYIIEGKTLTMEDESTETKMVFEKE